MKKIFITGGHFAPAKAVIDGLLANKSWQIYYLGRKFAMEDETSEAMEYQEIRKITSINYLVITTGRIQPKFFVNTFQSLKSFFKIFIGLGQSLYWLLKFHPDVVLSFGGYVAVPVVFWSWLLGIPVATHEQTVVSGRANKLVSIFADRVLVSWPDSLSHFPPAKTVLTGNPLRPEIVAEIKNNKLKTKNKKSVIYITGGNQGAHVLNLAVENIIGRLTQKYQVFHQTGDSNFKDYERLQSFASKNYLPAKFLTSREAAKILSQSDLVVSRAGANIVTEVLALGKPTIFIPIPWSNNHEQLKNAQMVASLGLAEILPQQSLDGKTLRNLITKVLDNRQKYLANAVQGQKLIIPDAPARIIAEITKLIRQ